MQQPTTNDLSVEPRPPLEESKDPKKPWDTPALEALALGATHSSLDGGNDGMASGGS